MDFLMGKVVSIFLTALIFKDGLTRQRFKEKIIFLFILMVLFTEGLSVIQEKMDSGNSFIIMDFNILVNGRMMSLMALRESKNIQMGVNMLAGL